jgi:hypothetical protein
MAAVRGTGPGERTHPAMLATYLVILAWAVWSWIRT